MPRNRCFRAFAALVLGWLTACAHQPASLDAMAREYGFSRTTVATRGGYRHRIVTAPGPPDAPVRIYMEGDGVPWLGEYVPARDPTPRTLVALDMMAAAGRPALYVGRPCYFGLASDPGCEPLLWTHARFGAAVQQSMGDAIRLALEREGWLGRPLVLIGMSGGGTLATLLAGMLPDVCALVTVASPLDIDEWADARGYSRLAGSDNPAARPALPASIAQLHLRGGEDRIVVADNGARFFAVNSRAERRVIAGAAHGREWSLLWPAIERQFVASSRCDGGGNGAPRARD
jgi:hypothetical protein